MIIAYTPQDGTEHRWDLKTARILSTEAVAVEKVTDLTWPQVKANLAQGSIGSLRAVAWILSKRDDPTLRYSQFDPAEEELELDFDAEERALLRAEVEQSEDLTDTERAQALAALADPEDANASASEDEGPKDGSGEAPAIPPADLPQTASPAAA